MKRCYLIAVFAVVAGFFSAPPVRAASPDSAVNPSAATHANQDLALDLGDGVKMEFVWIQALKVWVGKYEVTNGEYRKFKVDHNSGEFLGQSLNGDRQPVVWVNLDDAQAFVHWLFKRENKAGRLPEGYYCRLPSDDEWLTFAQCGDGREYPWGNDWPPPNDWNYHGQEGAGSWGKIEGHNDGFPVACPVEKSGRNAWGLYGVGGNVWEITVKAKVGLAFKAWRGASWYNNYQDILRCSSLIDFYQTTRYCSYGFRLVLAPPSRPP